MSEQKKVTVRCECADCGGTGLYIGIVCHDGAAMVCRNCKGNGFVEISYKPFVSRKKMTGIKRVFEAKSYTHFYPIIHTFDDGRTIDYNKYGCSFEEWENGVSPKPISEEQ